MNEENRHEELQALKQDTLTASGLLAFYEKTAGENSIHEITVDCENLDYISSAGLRVLLIMKKQSERGVTVKKNHQHD